VTAATAQQTRGALAALHDPGALERHPLAAGYGGGKALRRSLEDALAGLKPRAGKGGARADRRHRLLTLRYLDALPVEQVQRELLIGRSEYYREHERAIAALAALLNAPGASSSAPRSGSTTRSGNLPVQLSSFVGRQRELAELRALLDAARLVTLTGTGGAGKTRLALALAADVAHAYRDGAWFVDLAPLADDALVPGAALAALGARQAPGQEPLAALCEHLRGRDALLLLDNCEHLLTPCARVAETVLRACPGVRVLATSREPLGVGGETVYVVPSLGLPGPDEGADPASLGSYEAVHLFVERAGSALPSFGLTHENAAAVARVCQRLDGIPLALELAAARVRVLTVEQIDRRLGGTPGPFALLTGGSRGAVARQQTLRAAVDWSHDLLAEPERILLRRLGVFAGGWTLETAEAVCADEGAAVTDAERPALIGAEDVLDLLTALVDKSLVVAEAPGRGDARYRLLETIRAYALERLADAGEVAAIGARHTAYYMAMAEEAEPALFGPDARRWLDRLAREQDNLGAVLRRCIDEGAAEPGLRTATALCFAWGRGSQGPGEVYAWRVGLLRGWLGGLLALPAASGRTAARARALAWAGVLAIVTDEPDLDLGRRFCTEALEIARELGDQRGAAWALCGQAALRHAAGDTAGAVEVAAEALTLARACGQRWLTVFLHHYYVGNVFFKREEYAAAAAAFTEILALAREAGDLRATALMLERLGNTAFELGDPAGARASYVEARAAYKELGDRVGAANALQGLGLVALVAGDDQAALALLTECLIEQRDLSQPRWLAKTFEGLACVAAMRAGSDTDTTASARRAMRLAGAADALREREGPARSTRQRATLERWLTTAGTALGDESAAVTRAQGRAMTLDQAIADALGSAAD
jgi:predicted ATPase